MFKTLKYFAEFPGDVGFDDREILPDAGMDDGLYKSDDIVREKEDDHDPQIEQPPRTPQSPIDKEKQMDIDLPPPVVGDDDDFGGGFMGELFLLL